MRATFLISVVVGCLALTACPSSGPDFCPFDDDKTEAGVCGCGVSDLDSDGDEVPDCQDVCSGFDDRADHDGDGIADGCDGDLYPCDSDTDCDDGLDCTQDECDDDGLCRTSPNGLCAWPAEAPTVADNLTDLDDVGDGNPSGFRSNLSAAAWNPVSETLWVGSNGGPARIWAIDLSDPEDAEIATDGGDRAEWGNDVSFNDLEGLTLANFDEEETVYVLAEDDNTITEWDLSDYGSAELVMEFDLSGLIPDPAGFDGAEAITFVPDRFLAAQGFKNAAGDRVQSGNGMGGLMFVGHQAQGLIYVFDLDRRNGVVEYVGEYRTGENETAGLEFDRSTGLLYIWHGGSDMTLEVARLSSSEDDGHRTFDAQRIYSGPGVPAGGSFNLEGFAIVELDGCAASSRSAFLTTDDGGDWSLLRYADFPCAWR